MKPSTWRVLALTAICIAMAFAAFWWAFESPQGTFGISLANRSRYDNGYAIASVDPESPAAKAGIRAGDRLGAFSNPRDHLIALHPYPGDSLTDTVIAGDQTRTVTLVAGPGTLTLPFQLVALRVALLLVAALVAWRRPDDPAARNLVAFLTAFGFALGLNNHNLINPLVSYSVLTLGSLCALTFGTGALVRFSATFPTPGKGLRAFNGRLGTVISTLGIIAIVVSGWLIVTHNVNVPFSALIGIALASCTALAIANFVLSYRQAGGGDRQRILWVLLTFAVGLSAPFAQFVVLATGHYIVLLDYLSIFTAAALPVGLAYVILKHRLLDLGFVLNRAAVYGGVSLVLVAAFIVLEALIAKYVESQSHITSQLLSLGVPLALGFSMRSVHARVDRFVDDIFFRKRHLAEANMRRFAHEAMLVTDERVLLDRALTTVANNAQCTSVAIFVAAQDGNFFCMRSQPELPEAYVSQDDPAFLSMRTWHERCDLAGRESVVPGEFAFPFVVRGAVTGALVCGKKSGGEPYAPDELEAVAQLAHGTGLAYDALELAALKAEIARISGSEQSLARVRDRFHPSAARSIGSVPQRSDATIGA